MFIYLVKYNDGMRYVKEQDFPAGKKRKSSWQWSSQKPVRVCPLCPLALGILGL